jgi:hypothetical protein
MAHGICEGDDGVMRNGRAEIGETSRGSMGHKPGILIWTPICGSHQGRRRVPHQQAGHLTCTRPRAAPKNSCKTGAVHT